MFECLKNLFSKKPTVVETTTAKANPLEGLNVETGYPSPSTPMKVPEPEVKPERSHCIREDLEFFLARDIAVSDEDELINKFPKGVTKLFIVDTFHFERCFKAATKTLVEDFGLKGISDDLIEALNNTVFKESSFLSSYRSSRAFFVKDGKVYQTILFYSTQSVKVEGPPLSSVLDTVPGSHFIKSFYFPELDVKLPGLSPETEACVLTHIREHGKLLGQAVVSKQDLIAGYKAYKKLEGTFGEFEDFYRFGAEKIREIFHKGFRENFFFIRDEIFGTFVFSQNEDESIQLCFVTPCGESPISIYELIKPLEAQ